MLCMCNICAVIFRNFFFTLFLITYALLIFSICFFIFEAWKWLLKLWISFQLSHRSLLIISQFAVCSSLYMLISCISNILFYTILCLFSLVCCNISLNSSQFLYVKTYLWYIVFLFLYRCFITLYSLFSVVLWHNRVTLLHQYKMINAYIFWTY